MAEGGGSPEVPISENISANNPERWKTPHQATIISPEGQRVIEFKSVSRSVLTKEGQRLGQVLEAQLIVNPGDTQASLDFRFQKDPQGNYYVLSNGSQSWSSSVSAGKMNDKLVGMRPLEKAVGGKTVPFYDPGPGGEKMPSSEGRSYGWVGFRNSDPNSADIKEDLVLGVIPSFDSLEGIRFKREGNAVVVSVNKNLEGISVQRPVTFKVFVGEQSNLKYADLMLAYSQELSKLVNVPLMQDRAIGFSWPVYGKEVTQEDVLKEVEVDKDILDTYIIDAGWETAGGSLEADIKKFPDFADMPRLMREVGIKHPGIWVSPFIVSGGEARKLPQDWFMKDEQGRPRRIPLPGIAGVFERSLMLDISNTEVRAHLIKKMTNLAGMGYEVFKTDFLMPPFTGPLQNKEKTSVEYYREFFEEFRQSVRDQLNKEIEIIGCGAPMMESIGLFNGIRMTPDSAIPLATFAPFPNLIKPLTQTQLIGGKVNTELYHDAVAVGSRRILPLKQAYGLIWDGIHIADRSVPLNPDKKERLNISIQALNRLGVSNLFVGDSFARAGEQGRQVWRDFINVFKMGNVDIQGKYRTLPKIPERHVKRLF